MRLIDTIQSEFELDFKNFNDQKEIAETLKGTVNEEEGLLRVATASARLGLLIACVAAAILASMQIPVMIAAGSMSPFVGLAALSVVLYAGHSLLVEKDPYALTANNVAKNLSQAFKNTFAL